MKIDPRLEDVLDALVRRGLEAVEVYYKRGRSRRLETVPNRSVSSYHQERGWAVRAGGRRGSFFASGTGRPSPEGPWPEPDGQGLRLPPPGSAAPWREPDELDSPLIGEREGLALLDGIGRELAAELPGARLLHGLVEDGSSESEIASSRGVEARWRSRIAALRVEAAGPPPETPTVSLYLAEREARRFRPAALARRLADLLVVLSGSPLAERDRGELLLAPPVAVELVAGLLPLFVGPAARERARALQDRRGRLASERLTLVDDGRLEGGLLAAPVDGEGSPTRSVTLLEAGVPRQPLLAWWEVAESGFRATGCSRRPGWRDLPTPGPTHLYARPDERISVGALLGAVVRGYYLLDVLGPGRFHLEEDRFALPVCGMAVEAGRATEPVSRAWLTGSVSALLRGIQGVGRDLTFLPRGGMIGAPTLLAIGLELRPRPGA